jgi:hypothetical protein
MNLLNIEIERITCKNLCKAISFKKISDIETSKFNCALQYDDRYLVDKEIQQKFYITNTERNGKFVPQFLLDLNQFPIYALAYDSLNSLDEIKEKLDIEQIPYQVYNSYGVMVSPKGNHLRDFFILMMIEDENALFNIFNSYLFFLAECNYFVAFWSKELPCFSFHFVKSIDRGPRSLKEPIIFIDMMSYTMIMDYDAMGIEICDKNGIWDYDKLKKQLNSFSIIKYENTGYSCCDN